jgi:hypothetical protein
MNPRKRWGLSIHSRLLKVLIASLCATAQFANGAVAANEPERIRVVQPVQEYFLPLADKGFMTHLGTDCGTIGPGKSRITWDKGQVCVELGDPAWSGMWHSLAGLDCEKGETFNFSKCYPAFIREEFQPRCTGVFIDARGEARVRVEIKSSSGELLWRHEEEFPDGAAQRELTFDCPTEKLTHAKILSWNALARAPAGPGSQFCVDSLGLVLEFPKLPLETKVFLISYAKLARCFIRADGVVKDRANYAAGEFETVPSSGLFCLATCAAWRLGIVEREFAEQTLRATHHTISRIARAKGLLPHFLRKSDGAYRIHPGTEYSTVDSSLYYTSMLLASEMLEDRTTTTELIKDIKAIRFDELHSREGYVLHGLKDDGQTALASDWRDWGGETALVLLLERMATAERAKPKMSRSGKVYQGVGFIAEIQSLFYPQFDSERPDAVTSVNWVRSRRDLLKDQMAYFPAHQPGSVAAKRGVFGLSAGEAFRGEGYVADGTEVPNAKLIHPHYILMSGALQPRPDDVYQLLQSMESIGLFPPYGMVENVSVDLGEYFPMIGSLNASFECLSAYHLWAKKTGREDRIYEATRRSPILDDAIKIFYPLVAP